MRCTSGIYEQHTAFWYTLWKPIALYPRKRLCIPAQRKQNRELNNFIILKLLEYLYFNSFIFILTHNINCAKYRSISSVYCTVSSFVFCAYLYTYKVASSQIFSYFRGYIWKDFFSSCLKASFTKGGGTACRDWGLQG